LVWCNLPDGFNEFLTKDGGHIFSTEPIAGNTSERAFYLPDGPILIWINAPGAFPKTKAGRSHLLPLPTPVVGIFRSLASWDKSEWVFPGWGSTGHLTEPKMAWQRIRKRADVPDVRIHDQGLSGEGRAGLCTGGIDA
jgi:integrase